MEKQNYWLRHIQDDAPPELGVIDLQLAEGLTLGQAKEQLMKARETIRKYRKTRFKVELKIILMVEQPDGSKKKIL